MKKNYFIVLLLPLFLNGCVGRRVSYEPAPLPKDYKKSNSFNNFDISTGYKSFILKYNPKLAPYLAGNIVSYVVQYSKVNEVDPKLILALMSKESSFRSDAVSSSGAIGLGQLLKSTAKDMGINDPFNPEENTRATAKYIGWLIKKWQGNVGLALASYKIGHFTVTNLIKARKELPDSTIRYINEIKGAQARIIDSME